MHVYERVYTLLDFKKSFHNPYGFYHDSIVD